MPNKEKILDLITSPNPDSKKLGWQLDEELMDDYYKKLKFNSIGDFLKNIKFTDNGITFYPLEYEYIDKILSTVTNLSIIFDDNYQNIVFYDKKRHSINFYFSDGNITELPQFLKFYPNIKILTLSDLNITIIPDWIKYIHDLCVVLIYDTKIEDFKPLKPLNRLYGLRYNNKNIKEIPQSILELKQLTFLYIMNNSITDINPICQLPLLKSFSLTSNGVTKIPKEVLLMKKLRELNIKNSTIKHIDSSDRANLKQINIKAEFSKEIIEEDFSKYRHQKIILLQTSKI